MKAIFTKLSIDKQLYSMLLLGFIGFLLYFAVIFVISKQNGLRISNIVQGRIPIIAKLESLTNSINRVRDVSISSGLMPNIEGLTELEAANKKVQASFRSVESQKILQKMMLDQILEQKKKYDTAYGSLYEIFSNRISGLGNSAGQQSKLQTSLLTLSEISTTTSEMKAANQVELSLLIEEVNTGGGYLVMAGIAMIFCGIPFIAVFFVIMRNVISRIKEVSVKLNQAMIHVLNISSSASDTSFKLASASTEQASAVTETVSSMDEIKSMLGHTVDNSSAAFRSSEESYREATSGQRVVDELRVAMVDIDRAYGELEEVNRVVSMIRSKTNVINDIVFKTQLLSFNASIEAARAGQHGRGFSVVAAEVGKLAEVSGAAAQEIGMLLDQSTRKVGQIVESAKFKVNSANQMSLKCATVFDSITQRTGEARTMVDAIMTAATEQEAGIQQVSRAMVEMKDSSDQTDQMAQQIQTLSDALKAQSGNLAATISTLNVLLNGNFNNKKLASTKADRGVGKDKARQSA